MSFTLRVISVARGAKVIAVSMRTVKVIESADGVLTASCADDN